MSRVDGGPPRLARWLLDRLLPAADAGTATGDLDEEYARYVRPRRGRLRADLWYWRQVLLSAPGLVLRRTVDADGAGGSFLADVRFATRVLRRRPGFAVSAVVTLGLALGVNTTVYSVVHAVLVRPLPFHQPERLVRPLPDELFFMNGREAVLLGERMTTLETFAPWGRTLFLFTNGGEAEEVRGARVGWNHFDMLGVQARLGRTFVRSDAETDDAIVLSHGFWVRRFGADPDVVGRSVEMFGRSVVVVGVLGPDHVPMEYDWEAWRAMPLDQERAAGLVVAGNGRLRDGFSIEQAREELRRVLPEIWSEGGYISTEEERAGLELVPFRAWLLGDVRTPLLVLAGAVVFVLLLACANVANLLIAQGTSRSREFAVRAALGGARSRVARQVFVEVSLLGLLGGVFALALSWFSVGWFSTQLPADMPRATQISLSSTIVTFTLLSTIVVAALTAGLPAWRATGTQLAELTRGGRGASAGRDRMRLRSMLVSSEVAIAVLLVVGAGLMLRTLGSLRSVDPGFDRTGVVTVRPSPPSDRYPSGPELAAYYDEVTTALARVPGVESVGGIQFLPMTPGGWWTRYRPDGLTLADDANAPTTAARVVTEGYFRTMGIPLRGGRTFGPTDDGSSDIVPVVVNETFAREAFAGGDAVGRFVELGERRLQVVGVVSDVRQSDLRTTSHAEVYLPFTAEQWRRMHLVVRTDGDEDGVLASVAEVVRGVDPEVSMLGPRPMTDVVDSTIGSARLVAVLLTLFGLVGMGMGAVGVYGVTAQSVSERRREIGVRLALGAEATKVVRSTVLGGLRPVVVGALAGLGGALAGGRLLEGLLFEIEPTDPGTLVAAPAVLLLVALLSLTVPAVRASRIDPVRALSEE